jgi:hypothetical protein
MPTAKRGQASIDIAAAPADVYRLVSDVTRMGALTESFEFLWCPLGNRLVELPIPRGRPVNRGIQQTLARIQSAAQSGAHP